MKALKRKDELDSEYILGRWGPYQTFQLTVFNFMIWTMSFQVLSVVFIGHRPDFKCNRVNTTKENKFHHTNDSVFYKYNDCNIQVYSNSTNRSLLKEMKCINGYQYDLEKDSTFVTEMDLVCDDAEYAELSQTLVILGQAVGALLATSLSDKVGRKKVTIISHIGAFATGVGMAFVQDYATFAVLRFLVGVFVEGEILAGSVLALELFPKSSRYSFTVIGLVFWTTGCSLIAPVAYLLRDYSWRYIQITLSMYSVFSLFQYWLQDESVRWLIVNNKTKEAERIIHKVCKWNNIKVEELMKIVEKIKTEIQKPKKNDREMSENNIAKDTREKAVIVEHYSFLTIFQNKRLFINSFILWFGWTTNSLTYYALSLTSGQLAGNRYINYFLTSFVEYPACLIEFLMLRKLGRKTIVLTFHAVCGVAMATSTILQYFADGDSAMEVGSVVFTYIGKMAITGSFSTIWLYSPELYPTNLRSVGMGVCSTFGRIGSMVAPFSSTLAKAIPWLPRTIIALMNLIVSALILYLPETRGFELPLTLKELRAWLKKNCGHPLKSIHFHQNDKGEHKDNEENHTKKNLQEENTKL